MNNLYNTIVRLEKVKPISYGRLNIEAEVHYDYSTDKGEFNTWCITCKGDYVDGSGFGVDIQAVANMNDDGSLTPYDAEDMDVGGDWLYKENIEDIKEMIFDSLSVMVDSTEQVEDMLWSLVTFIERGLKE